MECLQCGKEFDGQGRARYCSGACKVRYFRVAGKDVTIAEDVTIGPDVPCNVVTILKVNEGEVYLDLEKDLGLNLEKDLGVMAWSENGIFIRPDITERQVRAIRDIVAAKNGWTERTFVPARRVS